MRRIRLLGLAALMCTGLALPAAAAWNQVRSLDLPSVLPERGTIAVRMMSDKIAIRPVSGDAQCSQIDARFANGGKRPLITNRVMFLKDHVYEFQLPNMSREVTRVDMTCHAANSKDMTMLVVMENRS
jgi:hypothetical protein